MLGKPDTPRGEMIDIGGGRRLRIVRAGAGGGPLCVLEHGAFGCASDWAVVQARLAAIGVRSLAYDRAGLGHSDAGPSPRGSEALLFDLHALLSRLGEKGPLIIVGHSMGGLMARRFAQEYPGDVQGLVLVDAVTPEITAQAAGLKAVRAYGRAMHLVGVGARTGMMRLVALGMGDLIGLEAEASADKRRIYGSKGHAVWSAAEVAEWPAMAAAAAGPLDPDLPVAVITAGAVPRRAWLKTLQVAPAQASRHGYVEHVTGATHANLLGLKFADPIVRGVEHVLKAAG